MTFSSVSPPSNPACLDAFNELAEKEQGFCVDIADKKLKVAPAVSSPDVQDAARTTPEADFTTLFINALSQCYGHGVAQAVFHELGLNISPDSLSTKHNARLSEHSLARAIDMAETSRQALEGVNFATRLACSALSGSRLFQEVCAQQGIAPGHFDSSRRAAIDSAMQTRFEKAVRQEKNTVSVERARQWLKELLIP